ncbi:MAG: hypothetical protein U5K79_20315 [Cyclobacteriaceae bacterium]|nr:hypothetical protein [Cyclobacteriaceae bacterium]
MQRFSSLVKSGIDSSDQRYLFQGSWTIDRFSIVQLLKIPNRYSPVIDGEIGAAESGLLIKIRFSLSPTTKQRLLIYTLVPLALTAFFILGFNAWLYGSITFSFAMVNYLLAREHFAAQTNKSRRALKRLFSAE